MWKNRLGVLRYIMFLLLYSVYLSSASSNEELLDADCTIILKEGK
jgi:hypothetical protein